MNAQSDVHFASISRTVLAQTSDNDVAGFAVDAADGLTVTEAGGTDTFTVVLGAQPDSDVVLSLTSGAPDEATLSTGTLTFTNGNWNAPQTVTVTGVNDFLIDGVQSSTITVAVNDLSSDPHFAGLSHTTSSSTSDNDVAGLVLDAGDGLSVTEAGTTDTLTLRLAAQPDTDVVVAIASGGTDEATVAPSSLTFTNANWNAPQEVTVSGVDDHIIDGLQTRSISADVVAASSDPNFAGQTASTSVSTVDNDVADFVIDALGGVAVSETGTTDTFTVVLTAQPDSQVVFIVTSGTESEAVPSGSLKFLPGNWDQPQTITITGADDHVVDGPQTVTITVAVDAEFSDPHFTGSHTVPVTVADDDLAEIELDAGGVSAVTEATGAAHTTTALVKLAAQPGPSGVTLAVSSGDAGEVSVSPAFLTFTESDWFSPKTVTLTGVDEPTVDGTQTTVITVGYASGDGTFADAEDQSFSVSTLDDDVAGLAISTDSLQTEENGDAATFTVALTGQPESDVVVLLSSSDPSEATVAAATFTFTSANWNTAHTFTVSPADDDILDGLQSATITAAVDDANSNNFFDGQSGNVGVLVDDDDSAGINALLNGFPATDVTVSELAPGAPKIVDFSLTAQPASDVVIDFTVEDPSEVQVSPSTITITPDEWNLPHPVTFTGVDDLLADTTVDSLVTFEVSADDSDPDFAGQGGQVTVHTSDDETASLDVQGTTVSATEGGTTGQFVVSLSRQPSSPVTLQVNSLGTDEFTVFPMSKTLAASEYLTGATFTVTALDDHRIDGNQLRTLTVSVVDASSADAYDGLSTDAISITTVDNDEAHFVVTQTGLSTQVTENSGAGQVDTFSIALTAQPDSDVVFSVGNDGPSAVSVSPSSLTIHPADWNAAHTVTVTGIDDTVLDGTQTAHSLIAVTSGDLHFTSALPTQTVNIAITDNELASLVIVESAGSTAVAENGASGDSFTVKLGVQPVGTVTLDVNGDGEASASPASLTFTSANWDTAQAVDVAALDDNFVEGPESHSITVSVRAADSDDLWDALGNSVVTATVTSDDQAGLNVAESDGYTQTSETHAVDTFTVNLTASPDVGQTVTVTVSSANTGEITVSPATLTFDSTNWALSQTVTATGVDESGPATQFPDGTQKVVITVATAPSSPASFQGLTRSFTAENLDNDGPTRLVSIAPHTEGTNAPDLRMAEDPADATRAVSFDVTITRSAQLGTTTTLVTLEFSGTATQGSDYTVSPADALPLVPGYQLLIPRDVTVRTITLTPTDDAVSEGPESVSVRVSACATMCAANGGNALVYTIDDNDLQVVHVVATGPAAAEGQGGIEFTFVRQLDSQRDLVVPYTVTGTATRTGVGSDFTMSPACCTITIPASMSSASIAVNALQDIAFEGPETIIVTLPTDATLFQAAGAPAVATILDDDLPTVADIVTLHPGQTDEGFGPGTQCANTQVVYGVPSGILQTIPPPLPGPGAGMWGCAQVDLGELHAAVAVPLGQSATIELRDAGVTGNPGEWVCTGASVFSATVPSQGSPTIGALPTAKCLSVTVTSVAAPPQTIAAGLPTPMPASACIEGVGAVDCHGNAVEVKDEDGEDVATAKHNDGANPTSPTDDTYTVTTPAGTYTVPPANVCIAGVFPTGATCNGNIVQITGPTGNLITIAPAGPGAYAVTVGDVGPVPVPPQLPDVVCVQDQPRDCGSYLLYVHTTEGDNVLSVSQDANGNEDPSDDEFTVTFANEQPVTIGRSTAAGVLCIQGVIEPCPAVLVVKGLGGGADLVTLEDKGDHYALTVLGGSLADIPKEVPADVCITGVTSATCDDYTVVVNDGQGAPIVGLRRDDGGSTNNPLDDSFTVISPAGPIIIPPDASGNVCISMVFPDDTATCNGNLVSITNPQGGTNILTITPHGDSVDVQVGELTVTIPPEVPDIVCVADMPADCAGYAAYVKASDGGEFVARLTYNQGLPGDPTDDTATVQFGTEEPITIGASTATDHVCLAALGPCSALVSVTNDGMTLFEIRDDGTKYHVTVAEVGQDVDKDTPAHACIAGSTALECPDGTVVSVTGLDDENVVMVTKVEGTPGPADDIYTITVANEQPITVSPSHACINPPSDCSGAIVSITDLSGGNILRVTALGPQPTDGFAVEVLSQPAVETNHAFLKVEAFDGPMIVNTAGDLPSTSCSGALAYGVAIPGGPETGNEAQPGCAMVTVDPDGFGGAPTESFALGGLQAGTLPPVSVTFHPGATENSALPIASACAEDPVYELGTEATNPPTDAKFGCIQISVGGSTPQSLAIGFNKLGPLASQTVFVATPAGVTAGGAPATIVFQRVGDLSKALTIGITIAATSGVVDSAVFEPCGGLGSCSLDFEAGSAVTSLTVTDPDASETGEVTITVEDIDGPGGYNPAGAPAVVVVAMSGG